MGVRYGEWLVVACCVGVVACGVAEPRGGEPQPPEEAAAVETLSPGAHTTPGNAWAEQLPSRVAAEELRITRQENRWHAVNRASDLRAFLGAGGIDMHSRTGATGDWQVELTTKSIGRHSGPVQSWAPVEPVEGACDPHASPGLSAGCARQIEYRQARAVEWWRNGSRGLEQGFDLASRPPGDGELQIRLTVSGDVVPRLSDDRSEVLLERDGDTILRYRELVVRDALGASVASRLDVENREIVLEIVDSSAAYPLEVDPILTALPTWETNLPSTSITAVGGLGDVNHDGFDDLAVSAAGYDGGITNQGRVWIFHGSTNGTSWTPKRTLDGLQAESGFGHVVTGIGDVNHDSYADIAISAPLHDNSYTSEGRVYIYHGSGSGIGAFATRELDGGAPQAHFGWSISAAGKLNNDLYGDMIIGTNYWLGVPEPANGYAYVFHGSSSGIGTSATRTLLGLNKAAFGSKVCGGGDVNGDGWDDVVVSDPRADSGQTDEGLIYVYHGSSTGIGGSANYSRQVDQANALFGYQLAMGDIDNDGDADLAVTALNYDNPQIDEGRVFVYRGANPGGLGASFSSSFESQQADTNFGQSLAIRDLNADGFSDLFIGAPHFDGGHTDEGRGFVYLGSGAGMVATAAWTFDADQTSAKFGTSAAVGDFNADQIGDLLVAASDYDNGESNEGRAFLFKGNRWLVEANSNGAWMGYSIAGAGDVNNDNYDDVIVGLPFYDNGQTDEGRAMVFHGSAFGLKETAAWSYEGGAVSANFGVSVSSAGKVNNDAYFDVLVGAPGYDGTFTDEGRAYVFHGSGTGVLSSPARQLSASPNQANSGFGRAVASAGNVNNDAYGDIIIGADSYTKGQTDEGVAFVYHGSTSGIGTSPNRTLEVNQPGAGFGAAVAGAGSVNPDAYGDVIVGAPYLSNPESEEGGVWVFHGSSSGVSPTAAWSTEGSQAGAHFGTSVSGGGSFNNDAIADIVVGAPEYFQAGASRGALFSYHGGPGGLTGQALMTVGNPESRLGASVQVCGDVDGDSFDDVAVGASSTATGSGSVSVLYGATAGLSLTGSWFYWPSGTYRFGSALGAGDFNNDGFADLVVGEPLYTNGSNAEGRVHVFFGSSSGMGWPPQP